MLDFPKGKPGKGEFCDSVCIAMAGYYNTHSLQFSTDGLSAGEEGVWGPDDGEHGRGI